MTESSLIGRLKRIADNDWRVVHIANTSDTAFDAIKEIEELRAALRDLVLYAERHIPQTSKALVRARAALK